MCWLIFRSGLPRARRWTKKKALDRMNTLATESQKRRIMYQAPIRSSNRDKVFKGLIDSKLTRERADAVNEYL